MNPSYGDRDPIAALATPLAESALALIRTSGSAQDGNGQAQNAQCGQSAVMLLAGVFSPAEKLLSAHPNSIVHGWIIDPASGKKIDEVLVSVFKSPRSYTGEDGADISCHGGIAVEKAIMSVLKKAGFREALPGEFTFRAFMNGKLDLTRAESVMELVAAKTWRAREQAVRRLTGALEKEIQEIKAMLVEVLANTEIYLDYSEDEFSGPGDDEALGRLPGRENAEKALGRLKALAELWRQERIYAEGALAVIGGRPNAGKSSLFNYLLREERSIVTDVPGTTRDWIEALISIEDIPLRLVDTAGLRDLGSVFESETCPAKTSSESSEAEQIGIKRSLQQLEKADIVLYVIDGVQGISDEDREFLLKRREKFPGKPIIIIWNKMDLAVSSCKEELPGEFLAVSAKTGKGIPELMRSIAGLLETASGRVNLRRQQDETAGPGTLRQKELIDAALASVEEALTLSVQEEPVKLVPQGQVPPEHVPLDVIAPLFRSAVNALGEITGEVSGTDILNTMFSRFCVGK